MGPFQRVARYIRQQSPVQNNAHRLNIYRNIEVRLQAAVRAYADQPDVLRYLRSIVHIQVPWINISSRQPRLSLF